MENENLEVLEETTNDIPEEVETVQEDIKQFGENDDLSSSDILSSVPDIGAESSSVETLEDLLREYFSASKEASLDSSNEVNGDSATNEISEIDYTELLEQILSNQEDSAVLQSSVFSYLEEYQQNNQMDSEVDNISLTNSLLLVVFMGILFVAVVDFARRIF